MTLNIDEHFAISKDIQNRLKQLDKDSKLVYFDLVDDNLFKPIKNYGDKIYIYNGFKKGRENIYGKKVYDEVVKRIPEFEYIYSNDLNLSYEKTNYYLNTIRSYYKHLLYFKVNLFPKKYFLKLFH